MENGERRTHRVPRNLGHVLANLLGLGAVHSVNVSSLLDSDNTIPATIGEGDDFPCHLRIGGRFTLELPGTVLAQKDLASQFELFQSW